MVKLTDTQWNIIYIGAGVLVLIVFSVFIWFDWEEIDKLTGEHERLQREIAGGLKKKGEIKKLKHELWFLKEKYEYFKSVLPKQEDVENFFMQFYENLENFRKEKFMKPWDMFQIKRPESEQNTPKKDAKGGPAQPPPPPPPRGAPQAGPFKQTEYQASICLTYNQLGQLLNAVENYEPFYGITKIEVSGMSLPKEEGKLGSTNELEGTVTLEFVNFSYSGTDPEMLDIKKALDKFEPDEDKKKEYEAEKLKWSEKNTFVWSNVTRDPFNEHQVLKKIQQPSGQDTTKKIEENLTIDKPLEASALQDNLKALQSTRDSLAAIAKLEQWMALERDIKDKKYEIDLKKTKNSLTPQNDKDGNIKNELDKMMAELKEWQKLIDEAVKETKAKQLVEVAEGHINKMQELYEKGKKDSSLETLESVKKLHNDIMPDMKSYMSFEKKIKQLGILRKRVEELYSKADNQIKIIQMAAKVKLYGIIYMKKDPNLSVAFIDKKAFHKNEIVNNEGFVVHEIHENEVVLRYKEETVPILLKKNTKNVQPDS